MRKLLLCSLFVSLTAWAQVIVPAGQTRSINSDVETDTLVGDTLFASAPMGVTVAAWSILSQDNSCCAGNVAANEVFFSIDNSGQLAVSQSLGPFFPFSFRAAVTVTLNVRAFGDDGSSDDELITIDISQGLKPFILPGQLENIAADIEPGTLIGDPVMANPAATGWQIVTGNSLGAFDIDSEGQFSNVVFLDTVPFPVVVNNIAQVDLTLIASNGNGNSQPETFTIFINLVSTGRCGDIPETQTRFINANAIQGANVGEPIDHHNLDAIWIEEAWLDGQLPNAELSSYFDILDTPSTAPDFAQIQVFRALSGFFAANVITKVFVRVRGHAPIAGCPEFIDMDVAIYVIPADIVGGVTPGAGPDISASIPDPILLACIREALGGTQTITAEQAISLTHLDCACRGINTLEGIHLFTGLTFLTLSNNLITDIRPLTGLILLTDLRLSGNLIADITNSNPLASLTGLINLDLSNNQIVDSNAFSTLINLEFLSLSDNQICEIPSLTALVGLPQGGFGVGDTINLDNNFLSSAQATLDLNQVETSGAFLTHFGNNQPCPPAFFHIVLETWPNNDVSTFANIFNGRAICPNDPP